MIDLEKLEKLAGKNNKSSIKIKKGLFTGFVMKNFIINAGRGLIDFLAFLSLFAIIIFSIITMINVGFLQGIAVIGIGLILLVYGFYTIYILVSIHDNLAEINNKLTNKQTENL